MAAERPLRVDARRNRERLLEVAVRAFSQDGPDVTLDAIAKEAGVGIGTLYRHFPTREALIDAAYRSELARLCSSAGDLLRDLPPEKALRAWMDRFVDYMTTKRGMDDALRALIASGGNPFSESRDRLTAAITTLLRAGAAAGTLRADVSPDDVLVSLSGLSLATAPGRAANATAGKAAGAAAGASAAGASAGASADGASADASADAEPERRDQAGRLLDLLMDALRARTT